MDTNNHLKSNPGLILGLRPDCGCCAGGKWRKGKTLSRVTSSKYNVKNRRAKPKSKDHRSNR